jgi:hypothetical protein
LWWGETSVKAYIPGRTFGGRGTGGGRSGVTPGSVGVSGTAAQAGGLAAAGGRAGAGFGGPGVILKYGAGKIGEFEGRIVGIADVMGDWREEIIVSLPGELRIYTTTIPTARRRPALMQDPIYRKDVALQSMGYFYPPQLSYHFR